MEKSREALKALRAGSASLESVCEVVAKEITENVGSTRASVWEFGPAKDEIRCLKLFDTRDNSTISGIILREDDFPAYFEAIKADMKVVAVDAATHPATSCFDEAYFVPNDIRSLLDFVIYRGAEPIAVLCCEHCTDKKNWSDSDVAYLQNMAALIGFAFR
jgi:GAF domain-containing protein